MAEDLGHGQSGAVTLRAGDRQRQRQAEQQRVHLRGRLGPFGKADSWGAPWVNLKLGVQYTLYTQFNGGTSNYDGFGRDASDNNALYVFAWLIF